MPMPMPMLPGAGSGMVGGSPQDPTMQPPMQAPPGGPAPDLFSLLGGSPSPQPMDPMAMTAQIASALGQFTQIERMVEDLARMFPGSEQASELILQGLQMWKQQLTVAAAPSPQMMPGAPGMA